MDRIILRDYQQQAADKGIEILNKHNIFYLMAEVRTGKTATVLTIAKNFENVLFITKLKAIGSIVSDFQKLGYNYNLETINYESIHKVKRTDYDLIIIDEAHRLGGYPKKPKSLKQIKEIKCNYHILLSGTPCPESWSQIYHQLDASKFSPFKEYKSFYKWAKEYVNVKKKFIAHGMQVNDYSESYIELIKQKIQNIVLTKTQAEAGFKSVITDEILTVKMNPVTYKIADRLLKDNIVEGSGGVILADTGVKLQQKLHQIYSGTVKLEDGSSIILDTTKAEYIKERFKGQTIGVFYKYKEEYNLIKEVFGDEITNDIEEHRQEGISICGQLQSIREGVNLSLCSALVFYNIDFSNVSYRQARDRMNGLDRLKNDVYFVFAEGGIESKIYRTVTVDKKKYDISAFKKDYLF
tara:strand:+ start:3109 stop:4338 length:1230 start_codon:yes stop_codon:yes gene_type:complete